MGGSSSSTIVIIIGCFIIDHHQLSCAVIEAASIGHVILIINASHDWFLTRDETRSCVFPFVILEAINVRMCWIMDGLRLTLGPVLVFLMNRDEATTIGGSSRTCLLWACFFYNQVPPRVATGVSWAREYHVLSFNWKHSRSESLVNPTTVCWRCVCATITASNFEND